MNNYYDFFRLFLIIYLQSIYFLIDWPNFKLSSLNNSLEKSNIFLIYYSILFYKSFNISKHEEGWSIISIIFLNFTIESRMIIKVNYDIIILYKFWILIDNLICVYFTSIKFILSNGNTLKITGIQFSSSLLI
jgi:hypothetical protein